MLGLALGIAGGIGKIFGRGAANRRLRNLMKNDPVYKENPLAKQRLGLAQTLLNARTPGAAAVERNIYSNQANTLSNLQRGATDASQLLALGSGVQGQTNDAFAQQGIQESQDYYNRLDNLTGAQQGMIAEGDKVFADRERRFSNQLQAEGVRSANNQASFGDVSNLGFSLMNYGMASGMGKMFGSNVRNRKPQAGQTRYYNGYTPNSEYGDFNTPSF